ncbi:MAG: hypothetical protein KatS3mg035_1145 [Bacteroidia bacterium]|nr:MAG: hypothetical protein KatS3mg035_1145 [Bacteroidia bacterium]
MSKKINIEELRVMIANQIKNDGLHEVLDDKDIENIINKVLSKQKLEKAQSVIPDVIPEQVESPTMATNPVSMPTTPDSSQEVPTNKYYQPTADLGGFGTGTTNSPEQIDQSTSGNIPAYTPELPSFMDKIEPGKIIVFDMNELSHGGENLSHTPFRTFENPDVKKTMNQMWIEDGKRKAEVYIAKFEKIGDIEFNYANGTSQFIEKRLNPDFAVQQSYKENPYMPTSTPKTTQNIDNSNIMAQISTAVDLEGVVKKIVIDLIQKGIMSNSAGPVGISEDGYGFRVDQAVKPMEESTPGYAAYKMFKGGGDFKDLNTVIDSNNFDLNMAKLVDDNGPYIKTELPEPLKEYIESGQRDYLKNENQEVEEWYFDGISYYLPKNRISKNKGYIMKK